MISAFQNSQNDKEKVDIPVTTGLKPGKFDFTLPSKTFGRRVNIVQNSQETNNSLSARVVKVKPGGFQQTSKTPIPQRYGQKGPQNFQTRAQESPFFIKQGFFQQNQNSHQIQSYEINELSAVLNINRDAVNNNHSVEINHQKGKDFHGDEVSFTVIKDHTESLLEDTQYDVPQDHQGPVKSKILIDENTNMSPEPNTFSKFSNIDGNTAQSKETNDLSFSQNTQQRILSNMVVLQSSGRKKAKGGIEQNEISCVTEPNENSIESPAPPMVSKLGANFEIQSKGDQSVETFKDPSSTQISKLDRHFMSPASHNQKDGNVTTQSFNPRNKTDNDHQSSISFDFRSKSNYITGQKQNHSKNSKNFQQFPNTFSSNSQVRGKTQNQKFRKKERNLAFFAGRNRVSNDLHGIKTITVTEQNGAPQDMSTSRDKERESSPDYQRRVSPPLHTFADSRIGYIQDSTGLNDIESSFMNENRGKFVAHSAQNHNQQQYQKYMSSKVSSRVNTSYNLVSHLNTPPISTPFSPHKNFQLDQQRSITRPKDYRRKYHDSIVQKGQNKFESTSQTFSQSSNEKKDAIKISNIQSHKFQSRPRPTPSRDISQHPGVLTYSLVEYLQTQNGFQKTPNSINQNGNFMAPLQEQQPKLYNKKAAGGQRSNMSQKKEKVFIGDLLSTQFRPKSQMRPKMASQQSQSVREGNEDDNDEGSQQEVGTQLNVFKQRHSSVKPQVSEAIEVKKPSLQNAAAKLKVGKILGLMLNSKKPFKESVCLTSPTIQDESEETQPEIQEHQGLTQVQIALKTSEMQKALQKQKIKNFFKGADFSKYLAENNIKVGKDRIEDTVTHSKSPLTQTQRRPIINEQNLLIENGEHQIFKSTTLNKVYERRRTNQLRDEYDSVIGQISSKATDRENLQTIINAFRAERREMPLSVSAFIGQISSGDQVKKIESGLTNQEIVEMMKEKNNQIFKNTCIRVAQLVQFNKMISKVESYQPVELQMQKVSAIFYKVPVEKKMAPLKIMFRNLDHNPANNGHDFSDMQLFYSFSNQYPCCDEIDGKRGLIKAECDGFFEQNKICNIGNFSDNKFSQKYCYIGIYTRKGLKDYFSFGFGDHCEKLLTDSFKKMQDDGAPEPPSTSAREVAAQNSLSDGEEEVKTSEIKMYNHKKQLEYFKMQMDEKIAELIKKQIEEDLITKTIETKSTAKAKKQIQQKQIKNTEHSDMMNSDILDSEVQLINEDSMHDNQNIAFSEQFQTINLINCPQIGKYEYQKKREIFNQKQAAKKDIQAVQIKQLELEKLKLKIFLTFKHDLLKDIKNQKLDELVAVLRKRKFARVWILSRVVGKAAHLVAKNLKRGRDVKIGKFYRLNCKLRIELNWRRYQTRKYGKAVDMPERAKFNFIQPALKFQYMVMRNKIAEQSMEILRFYLHKRMKERQFPIKAMQFIQKIRSVETIMKQVTTEKKGQIQKIKEALEQSRKQVNKSIMDSKTARKFFDWVLRELHKTNAQELDSLTQGGQKQSPMDVMAKKLHSYCKAVHAMDHVRWQSQQLTYVHKPYNFQFVMDILKQFNKEKVSLIDHFSEKLIKYPKDIDFSNFSPPTLVNQATLQKTKSKKGKGAKPEESKSPALVEKKPAKKIAKANTKQKKQFQDYQEEETDMSKPCYYDQLERLFIENDVPMRTLDLNNKPVFNVENIIESAKERDPSKISKDLEDIGEEASNDPDSVFVRENQWNLSLSKSVFKACILWTEFDDKEKAHEAI